MSSIKPSLNEKEQNLINLALDILASDYEYSEGNDILEQIEKLQTKLSKLKKVLNYK